MKITPCGKLFFGALLGATFIFLNFSYAETFTVLEINKTNIKTVEGPVLSLSEIWWRHDNPSIKNLIGAKIEFDPSKFQSPALRTNRYGDLRGKILLKGIGWLQRHWISEGIAFWQGGGPYPSDLTEALQKAEGSARKQRRGVWQKQRVLKVGDLEKTADLKGFQIVEAMIMDVKRVRGTTYLNFGSDWRTDFTVAILPKYRSNFKNEGWKSGALMNKWIRIRGLVRFYNGPYMELYFPEQVEFLGKKQD